MQEGAFTSLVLSPVTKPYRSTRLVHSNWRHKLGHAQNI